MLNGLPMDAEEGLRVLEAAYAALRESSLKNHEAQIANFLRTIRGKKAFREKGAALRFFRPLKSPLVGMQGKQKGKFTMHQH